MFENVPLLKVLPPPPDFLDETDIKFYEKNGNKLIDDKILTELDLTCLHLLCRSESLIHRSIKEDIKPTPEMIKNYNDLCNDMMLHPLELLQEIKTI